MRLKGVIGRRILLNWRVEPDAIRDLVPAPFRLKLVDGKAIAGVCLLRTEALRPAALPAFLGRDTENAAHRIAVEWDDERGTHDGVLIFRRHTGSLINCLVGPRFTRGPHGRARFETDDDGTRVAVAFEGNDGTRVDVAAHAARSLPEGSVFRTIDDATRFFQNAPTGWTDPQAGIELRTPPWTLTPLAVERVASSFFDGLGAKAKFDCAVILRDTDHEWVAARPAASPDSSLAKCG